MCRHEITATAVGALLGAVVVGRLIVRPLLRQYMAIEPGDPMDGRTSPGVVEWSLRNLQERRQP